MWWAAFVNWLRKVPYWAWLALLVIVTGRIWLATDRKRHEEKGREEADAEHAEQIEKANQQTQERAARAKQAGDDIEEQLFDAEDDAARVRELNLGQLRELTNDDSHNRGRVVRGDGTD